MSSNPSSSVLRRLADLIDRPAQSVDDVSALAIRDDFLKNGPDDFAAEHYRILTHDMTPAASMFLGKKAMQGGDVAARVRDVMSSIGYEPDTSSYPADHLVNVFRFMAYADEAGERTAMLHFVDAHLLSWLPILLQEFSASAVSFFEDVAALIESILSSSPGAGLLHESDYPPLLNLPFDLDKAELAAIGIYLATPIESGLFVSKSRLASEARRLRLPTGFGTRGLLIEGLFRSAGQYEAVGSVCDFFEREVADKEKLWSRWSGVSTAGEHWATRWQEKLSGTRHVLDKLRTAESA